jgi:hypothetical protein
MQRLANHNQLGEVDLLVDLADAWLLALGGA